MTNNIKVFTDEFLSIYNDKEMQDYIKLLGANEMVEILKNHKTSMDFKSLPVQPIAYVQGKISEENICEYLINSFPKAGGYEIESVGSRKKMGDIKITFTGKGKVVSVLIELKDYKNRIPTVEIEKFKRDVERIKPSSAIFVSMNTKISGYAGSDTIRCENMDGTMITYLAPLGEKIILKQMIDFHISCGMSSLTCPKIPTEYYIARLKDNITVIQDIVNDLNETELKMKKNFAGIIKKLLKFESNMELIIGE